jgi:hypothetical protein
MPNRPALHAEHLAAPRADENGGAQLAQKRLPPRSLKRPGAHRSQLANPAFCWNLPGGQGVQAWTDDCGDGWNVPGAQGVHADKRHGTKWPG